MAQTALSHVLQVVEQIGLTRMMAYDADGHTLEHAECESKTDLCERITQCVNNNTGLLRIDAWQAAPERQPGQRKADIPKVERCTWRVRGLLGAPVPVTVPIASPVAGGPAVQVPSGMDVATAVAHARLQWEVEQLRAQVKERDALDDEDEDEDEPIGNAQDISKPLFGMTGQQTFDLLKGFQDMLPGMVGRPAQTLGGAPQLSAGELKIWEAFKRFRAAQPELAADVIAQVMGTYGPDAPTPTTDEK